MGKFLYYAIRAGFVPGVYPTWNEAKAQIQGYRYSKHKGFDDLAEAEAFARAPLVRDRFTNPFMVIHDGDRIGRIDLTPEVRAALFSAGIDLSAL